MPRLKRMWTHLSRQKNSVGLRGPGEKQLEEDRRLVEKRIRDLRRELQVIEKRKQRERAISERPTVEKRIGELEKQEADSLAKFSAAREVRKSEADRITGELTGERGKLSQIVEHERQQRETAPAIAKANTTEISTQMTTLGKRRTTLMQEISTKTGQVQYRNRHGYIDYRPNIYARKARVRAEISELKDRKHPADIKGPELSRLEGNLAAFDREEIGAWKELAAVEKKLAALMEKRKLEGKELMQA